MNKPRKTYFYDERRTQPKSDRPSPGKPWTAVLSDGERVTVTHHDTRQQAREELGLK